MGRYLFQLRRGWKDNTISRDDWATYEKDSDHLKPQEGELVLEYDNGTPRLKIGDGIHEFSELEYMSVDSFLLPKPISVTLYANKWKQALDVYGKEIKDTYCQVVTVENAVITENSKVDLVPSPTQLLDFYDLGITFTSENDSGVVQIYAVGDKPSKSYIIQAVVTEVIVGG